MFFFLKTLEITIYFGTRLLPRRRRARIFFAPETEFSFPGFRFVRGGFTRQRRSYCDEEWPFCRIFRHGFSASKSQIRERRARARARARVDATAKRLFLKMNQHGMVGFGFPASRKKRPCAKVIHFRKNGKYPFWVILGVPFSPKKAITPSVLASFWATSYSPFGKSCSGGCLPLNAGP